MVTVSVLFFGVLKDLMGAERRSLELPDETCVAGMLRLLETPDARVWRTLAVAVNREYAGLETVLRDGDEVALLPPVSGGVR